jgi:hypothetical protein
MPHEQPLQQPHNQTRTPLDHSVLVMARDYYETQPLVLNIFRSIHFFGHCSTSSLQNANLQVFPRFTGYTYHNKHYPEMVQWNSTWTVCAYHWQPGIRRSPTVAAAVATAHGRTDALPSPLCHDTNEPYARESYKLTPVYFFLLHCCRRCQTA